MLGELSEHRLEGKLIFQGIDCRERRSKFVYDVLHKCVTSRPRVVIFNIHWQMPKGRRPIGTCFLSNEFQWTRGNMRVPKNSIPMPVQVSYVKPAANR